MYTLYCRLKSLLMMLNSRDVLFLMNVTELKILYPVEEVSYVITMLHPYYTHTATHVTTYTTCISPTHLFVYISTFTLLHTRCLLHSLLHSHYYVQTTTYTRLHILHTMYNSTYTSLHLLMLMCTGVSTKSGIAVGMLQQSLPGARVIYSSATGVTQPSHMAYMSRYILEHVLDHILVYFMIRCQTQLKT